MVAHDLSQAAYSLSLLQIVFGALLLLMFSKAFVDVRKEKVSLAFSLIGY